MWVLCYSENRLFGSRNDIRTRGNILICLTQVTFLYCMETSLLYERNLPLATDELEQASAAKTFEVTLSIHPPRLLLTSKFTPFAPSSIKGHFFNTFVSFIQSERARLGKRAMEHTSSGSDWCLPAACAAGHRSHSICRPGIGFPSDQRHILSFILFHPQPRYRPRSQ